MESRRPLLDKPRIKRVGYDLERIYTPDELKAMYIAEGKSEEEAASLSVVVAREIERMIEKDRRAWARYRKRKIPLEALEPEDHDDMED